MAEEAIQHVVFQDLPGLNPYEDFDFEPYFQEVKSEDELRKTWRVFTKVKDVLDNGRRLENASWRLWFNAKSKGGNLSAPGLGDDLLIPSEGMPRKVSGSDQQLTMNSEKMLAAAEESALSELEKFDLNLDKSLKQAHDDTTRMVGDMFGDVSEKYAKEKLRADLKSKADRTRKLFELQMKHDISEEAMDELLQWVRLDLLQQAEFSEPDKNMFMVPETVDDAKALLEETKIMPRKRCAAFSHSLERNGANNFLLYLVRELKDELAFRIIAPKDGPMKDDYQTMGIPVSFADMKSPTYPEEVRKSLEGMDYALANTIMTTEVVIAAKELGIASLWVIHEAWPKDQFEYYAKEVFLMNHLDANKIVKSFAEATRIVFPANVQKQCYDGLFQSSAARVIYNGIPLAALNAFRAVQSRKRVRAELGYGDDDLLVVQLGTVCKRKGQLVTAKAFAELIHRNKVPGKQPKLLMVGARYIRQHEIEYIDNIKAELQRTGADVHTTILDVKKNVLPYYHAADIVVCPSLNEVLPLVICEAMAFERPVIATRIDGIPEAMTDNVEGFLIPPGEVEPLLEKMELLLHDEELRKKMGAAGRQRVLSQFSFSVMAARYRETVFESLQECADANAGNKESVSLPHKVEDTQPTSVPHAVKAQ
mmetsp:Transcript_4434/g.8098  ORF Transcript_4434/g.8098 Transcript_4434/m.8098 type:complete len:650 (-) Transcript_4434:224-2173(-)